jgi:hypothetical protein
MFWTLPGDGPWQGGTYIPRLFTGKGAVHDKIGEIRGILWWGGIYLILTSKCVKLGGFAKFLIFPLKGCVIYSVNKLR